MNALIAVFMLLATTLVSAQTVPAAALTWQRTLIREAQSTIGVSAPAATLAGQLHQESGWRSDARSAVGAQGLAQFMPATAEWIAQVKPKRLSPVNPLDPRWSIMAQMEFMAFLLRRNPGATECDQWAFALNPICKQVSKSLLPQLSRVEFFWESPGIFSQIIVKLKTKKELTNLESLVSFLRFLKGITRGNPINY